MPKYRVRSGKLDYAIETPFPAKPKEIVLMAILAGPTDEKKLSKFTEVSGGQYKGRNIMYVVTESVLEDMGMLKPNGVLTWA